jgi:hypothetical protein
MGFTWIGSNLTCKHLNKRERLARYKHSSLLQKSVLYGQKGFNRYHQAPVI